MAQTAPAIQCYVVGHKACLNPTLASGHASTPPILPLRDPASSSRSEIATSLSPHGAQCESGCVYMQPQLIEEQIAGDRYHCFPSLLPLPPPLLWAPTCWDPSAAQISLTHMLTLSLTHTHTMDNLR